MSDVLKELLPCPFCGSDDIHTTSGRGTGFRQYHCNSCHAKGPVVDAVYDGDKSWNTRAQSDLTAQLTPPKDAGELENVAKSLAQAMVFGTGENWQKAVGDAINFLSSLPHGGLDVGATIKQAKYYDRRECFADSADGMNASIIFGELITLAQANRKGGV